MSVRASIKASCCTRQPQGFFRYWFKRFNTSQMACVKPFEDFDPAQDAIDLEKAMKGIGCNEQAIIDILAYRSAAQRRDIEEKFIAQFGKNLQKTLVKELKGKFEQAVIWSFGNQAQVNAKALSKAINRMGTDEEILIDVLCTATNKEIHQIKEAYKTEIGRDLEEDIAGDTSGDFKKVLVALLQASREEGCDPDQAKKDSFDLYQAGVGKKGTDEGTFTRILCTRSWKQLRKINEIYIDNYGHDIIKAISKEVSGDYKSALTRIMQTALDRKDTLVEMLYNSMKGLGTRDDSLIRLILAHSETDLAELRDLFEEKYSKTLAKMIEGDTSGDYRKFLLAIVNQN